MAAEQAQPCELQAQPCSRRRSRHNPASCRHSLAAEEHVSGSGGILSRLLEQKMTFLDVVE